MNKLRLATWNVCKINPHISKGLDYLFYLKPDIVSLQEVQSSVLDLLHDKYPNYKVYKVKDFNNKKSGKITYSCLLTHHKIKSHGRLKYSKFSNNSFLSAMYKLNGNVETNNCVYIDFVWKRKPLRFFGMRFSSAVSSLRRLEFAKCLLVRRKRKSTNIIMGDLNIGTGKLYSFFTGLVRGYSGTELFQDERIDFDLLLEKQNYLNYFSKKSTSSLKYFKQQFDHILIPKAQYGQRGFLSKSGFGSDHLMLFLDINIKKPS